MTDTFDPNDYKNPLPDPVSADTEVTPSEAERSAKEAEEKFAQSVVNLEDLSEDKQAEYAEFIKAVGAGAADADDEAPPEEESPANSAKDEAVTAAINLMNESGNVDITDDMRESFTRSLMSNTPYTNTTTINDKLSVTFRTLTVKEYDAIADAVGKLSMGSGFVNAGHLKFINFRYTVSTAITSIKTKDDEGRIQIFNYTSPLEEYTATHREEVMEIQQLDGTTKEKVTTVPITDADRILQAHEERFNDANSTLYNVLLNTYTQFDNEVYALSSELYSKNFTAPIATSSS